MSAFVLSLLLLCAPLLLRADAVDSQGLDINRCTYQSKGVLGSKNTKVYNVDLPSYQKDIAIHIWPRILGVMVSGVKVTACGDSGSGNPGIVSINIASPHLLVHRVRRQPHALQQRIRLEVVVHLVPVYPGNYQIIDDLEVLND